jgi:(S)-ureidoglycine aminohydrolase
MKKNLLLFFAFLSTIALGQPLVKAGVYRGDGPKTGAQEKTMILAGETQFFQFYEFSSTTLSEKGIRSVPAKKDNEQVVIVMDGELQVAINKVNKILSRGGVAHILPGEMFALTNAGKSPVTFYLMEYKSRASVDHERGTKNGGSVAMRWDQVEKKTTDKGFSRIFYNHPTSMTTKFDMHATTLKPGVSSHAPHTHAEEEIVLMLRGKGRMNIDGKFYDVAPGQLSYLSSGISHAIENSGDEECEYFAFQWK